MGKRHVPGCSTSPPPIPSLRPVGLKADAIREMFSQDKIDKVLKMNEGKDMDMNAFLSQLKTVH